MRDEESDERLMSDLALRAARNPSSLALDALPHLAPPADHPPSADAFPLRPLHTEPPMPRLRLSLLAAFSCIPASSLLVNEAGLATVLGFAGVVRTPVERKLDVAPDALAEAPALKDQPDYLTQQYLRATAVVNRQRAFIKGSSRMVAGLMAVLLSGWLPQLHAFAVEPPVTEDFDVVRLITMIVAQASHIFGDGNFIFYELARS